MTATRTTDPATGLLGVPLPDRRFFRGISASYPRLLGYVKPYWPKLVGGAAFLMLGSLAGLATPWIIRYVVDAVFLRADMRMLNLVLLGLVLLAALQGLMGFGQIWLVSWVGQRVVANLRTQLYEHLHHYAPALLRLRPRG